MVRSNRAPRDRSSARSTRPHPSAASPVRRCRTPADARAKILEQAAELLEQRAARFIALLQREGGKTLDDALSEVRETIDFCRYYAAEGRELFGHDKTMPGHK